MKSSHFLLALTFGLIFTSNPDALAQDTALKVGDPAPKFVPASWAQGEPITSLKPGAIHILGFFSSSSAASSLALHHLNALHLKYHAQNVRVIGQSVWEKNTQDLAAFLQSHSPKWTYPIASDNTSANPKGVMAETWLNASGRNVVPTAFVVDKTGMIAWIGHPLDLPDTLIPRILDGAFNLNEAAAAYQNELRAAAQMKQLWARFNAVKQSQDWPAADALLQEISQLTPPNRQHQLDLIRINFYLERKDPSAALRLAQKISDANPTHALLLNEVAWLFASAPNPDSSTLAVAETAALRANTAAQGKSPGILDTLARIQFLLGQKEKAISTQTRAVELAAGQQKEQFQQVLSSYRAGKLPPTQQQF